MAICLTHKFIVCLPCLYGFKMLLSNKFSKISDNLFLISAFTEQAKFFLNGSGSVALKAVVLLLKLTAFCFWFTASLLFPIQRSLTNKIRLRDFHFRWQNIVASISGVMATLFFIMAFLHPIFAIPASFCSAIGNIFWFISEVQKFKAPPYWIDEFNSDKQKVQIKYAGFMTASSVVSALLISAAFVFPQSNAFIFAGISIYALILSVNAVQYLLLKMSLPPKECKISNSKSDISEVSASLITLSKDAVKNPSAPSAAQEKSSIQLFVSAAKRMPLSTKSGSKASNSPPPSNKLANPPVATTNARLEEKFSV